MKPIVVVMTVLLGGVVRAQEPKPVPKDSVRVSIPGCTRGYAFTAGPRTEDQVGRASIPEGMHFRMSAPKKMMTDLKNQRGTMIEITGLIRKNDLTEQGVRIGPLRLGPASSMGPPGAMPSPADNEVIIDVEGWRPVPGDCPLK